MRKEKMLLTLYVMIKRGYEVYLLGWASWAALHPQPTLDTERFLHLELGLVQSDDECLHRQEKEEYFFKRDKTTRRVHYEVLQ